MRTILLTVALVLMASAHLIRGQSINCGGFIFSDANGCCPIRVNETFLYRDAQGCYPIVTDVGIQYADSRGCYPSQNGTYNAQGVNCTRPCQVQCFNTTANGTALPSPGVSPAASASPAASGSPATSPAASGSPAASASPATSPAASASPARSPAASASPATSPAASGSPATSPAASPARSPAASASPATSPAASGSPATSPAASGSPAASASPATSPAASGSPAASASASPAASPEASPTAIVGTPAPTRAASPSASPSATEISCDSLERSPLPCDADIQPFEMTLMEMRPITLNCFCQGTDALIDRSGIVGNNDTDSGDDSDDSAPAANALPELAIEKICRRTCSSNLCGDSCLRVFASENSTQATVENDIAVLNFALTLENLDSTFYSLGLQKFTAADFEEAGFNNNTFFYFTLLRDNELAHAEALRSAIRALGGTPVEPCEYNFTVRNVTEFVNISRLFENTGVSAYDETNAFIYSPDLQTASATIASVEARQASYLNLIGDRTPFPLPQDVPEPIANVIRIASRFIVSCPDEFSNQALEIIRSGAAASPSPSPSAVPSASPSVSTSPIASASPSGART